jgi:hypothetical protein
MVNRNATIRRSRSDGSREGEVRGRDGRSVSD